MPLSDQVLQLPTNTSSRVHILQFNTLKPSSITVTLTASINMTLSYKVSQFPTNITHSTLAVKRLLVCSYMMHQSEAQFVQNKPVVCVQKL